MKKVIILGAMSMHVPLIKYAKSRGYYVITVDYTVDAPGHKIADYCSFESTTDLAAVERIAIEEQVDIVMTFNSDPAVYTAAHVSERLKLQSNSTMAVSVMSDKGLFRQYLKENGFQTPKFEIISCSAQLEDENISYPSIIKPVDSSGSKGVFIASNHFEAVSFFEKAKQFSRSQKVIVEELIETDFHQLHGDCFVRDGRVVASFLGDHHFNKEINGLVPYSTTFPTTLPLTELERVNSEIQRFVSSIGFSFGGINIEARINKKNGEVYLIEVGARNGGNFTYKVILDCYGFDFMKNIFDCYESVALDNKIYKSTKKSAYYIIHSSKNGQLKDIQIGNGFKDLCYKIINYKSVGDYVSSFTSSDKAIGVMLVSDVHNIYQKIVNHKDNVLVVVDE